MAQPQDELPALRPVPRDEQEQAALLVLAQILANVIKRDVDAQLKESRRVGKSV